MKGTMSSQIQRNAGTFKVVRGYAMIRGQRKRTATLVFTSHDGYVGESRARMGRFDHEEAYRNAMAKRDAAIRAKLEAANPPPKTWERCNKPAPVAQLLHSISEHLLFSEVERRGFEVAIP
jgi:hypothetical protein